MPKTMSNLVILKTHPENLVRVVELQKHALQVQLSAGPGDLLLLAETRDHGPARVRYGMWFKSQRPANPGETEAIWGRHWNFIIEGEGRSEFTRSFIPQERRVTQTNYGQGGPFVYVDPEDAEAWRQQGLLAPLLA